MGRDRAYQQPVLTPSGIDAHYRGRYELNLVVGLIKECKRLVTTIDLTVRALAQLRP